MASEEKSASYDYDVLIIGGGPAGLSAAMTLGRFLHKVLVCEDNRPRNVKSLHANNLPASDGISPMEWRGKVRTNLEKYKTVEILDKTTVKSVIKTDKKYKNKELFEATIEKKSEDPKSNTIVNYKFRRIILAYGMIDGKPDPSIEGFDELWGKSVFHCPFCHGYEVINKKIGLLVEWAMMAQHLIPVLYGLSNDIILFTNGKKDMFIDKPNTNKNDNNNDNNEEKKQNSGDSGDSGDSHGMSNEKFLKLCEKKGIKIIHDTIKSLNYNKNDLTLLNGVVLSNGDIIDRNALFYGQSVPIKLKSDIGDKLGCKKSFFGHIECNEKGLTNINGVYAAGDCMSFASVLSSAAGGQEAAADIVFDFANENFD